MSKIPSNDHQSSYYAISILHILHLHGILLFCLHYTYISDVSNAEFGPFSITSLNWFSYTMYVLYKWMCLCVVRQHCEIVNHLNTGSLANKKKEPLCKLVLILFYPSKICWTLEIQKRKIPVGRILLRFKCVRERPLYIALCT